MCLSSTFWCSLGLSPMEQERDRSSRPLLLFVSCDPGHCFSGEHFTALALGVFACGPGGAADASSSWARASEPPDMQQNRSF